MKSYFDIYTGLIYIVYLIINFSYINLLFVGLIFIHEYGIHHTIFLIKIIVTYIFCNLKLLILPYIFHKLCSFQKKCLWKSTFSHSLLILVLFRSVLRGAQLYCLTPSIIETKTNWTFDQKAGFQIWTL